MTAVGGWREVGCHCHYGTEHGGEVPRECRECGGKGYLYLSPSGTRLAHYPGGPFSGRSSGTERPPGACWCEALKLPAAAS